MQILLGSLKKGSESAGACVSQCISCGLPLVYTSHMLPYAALGSPSHLPPDIRPYGFCLKFGGGSFTFADTPRELEKRERERRCLCESVYIYIYMYAACLYTYDGQKNGGTTILGYNDFLMISFFQVVR